MSILLAALCGFALDLLLGDPERLAFLHPVVWMGKSITKLETILRRRFPKTDSGERRAGLLLAFILPLGTLLVSTLVLAILNRILPPLGFALSVIWCWQALAVKDLRVEAMRVFRALKAEGLEAARTAVSRIVLILLMYFGRIGGLSLALAFADAKETPATERPVEKIMIG